MEAARFTWDTRAVPKKDSFSYFRETVCKTYQSLTCTVDDPYNFYGRIEGAIFENGSASITRVPSVTIERTRADLASMQAETFSLHLVLDGRCKAEWESDSGFGNAGDLTMHYSNQRMIAETKAEREFSVLVLEFSKPAIDRFIRKNSSPKNFRVTTQRHALALNTVVRLLRRRLASGSLNEVGALHEAALALVAAYLIDDAGVSSDELQGSTQIGRSVFIAIQNFIDDNLANPDLSLTQVAVRFDISTRYIHKLFENNEETFSRYIAVKRIEMMRNYLLDPSTSRLSIPTVANMCGLNNMAGVHRIFKARFGATPGQLRAAGRE